MYHGKKNEHRKKRKYEVGREFIEPEIGEKAIKTVKTKGGGTKVKLLSAKFANVLANGKNIRCEVISVTQNPANKDYTRRNIITKGAILNVKTPDGRDIKAKVTSRPGNDGVLNAISI
ncbi:MAG: 30S ribosomal protein S8e [Candidatus Altiarchaeota archaeon]